MVLDRLSGWITTDLSHQINYKIEIVSNKSPEKFSRRHPPATRLNLVEIHIQV